MGDILTSELLLDPQNPRLPEGIRGAAQDVILAHLHKTAALDELALSIQENGFFRSEPVIAARDKTDGKHTILEGNRRLATALILTQDARAVEAGVKFNFLDEDLDAESNVLALPVVEVDDEKEFRAYLGFRHISGLRTWGAGEKARYLFEQVNAAKPLEGDKAFYAVGRTVGSNSRGVRNAYIAYALLLAARPLAEAEITDFVLEERFGVWSRALGTANVTRYIRLPDDLRTPAEVDDGLEAVDESRLIEVLSDLSPTPARAVPLLADSRKVTAYSTVLGSAEAIKVLRETQNIDIAEAVVAKPKIEVQLQDILDRIDVLQGLLVAQDQLSESEILLIDRFRRTARILVASSAALTSDSGI